jgi:4-hydroxybenzoate polyprenyltransferase
MNTVPHQISFLDRIEAYARLVRLDKPIGILLLLWPTLWALWIAAKGIPDLHILGVFVAGVVVMRSAGCAINDYADRHIDPLIERTRLRPLATGIISPKEALVVFIVLALIALGLVFSLNPLTRWMSVAAVVLAASYPFMKRFHHLPQVNLGIAFAWAVPMAFTAVTASLPGRSGWLIFLAFVIWTVAFDTMYAMVDREDDLKIGVKSTAILFGDADKMIIATLQILMLLTLIFIGRIEEFHWPYFVALAIASIMGLYQQFLIRQRQRADCLRAFLNNNYLGLVVFLGIAAEYYGQQ